MYEREGRKWKIEKESGVLDMMDGAAMRGGGTFSTNYLSVRHAAVLQE